MSCVRRSTMAFTVWLFIFSVAVNSKFSDCEDNSLAWRLISGPNCRRRVPAGQVSGGAELVGARQVWN